MELYCVVAVALPPQCDGACGENMGVQSRIVLCYTREGQVTNDSECDRQSKPISIQPCTRNCSLVAVWKSSDWSQVCVCACMCVWHGVHVCMCEHMDVTLLLPSFLPVCSSALHSVEQLATERVWLHVLSSMNKGMLSAWMNHALHPSPQLMRHAKHPVVG